MRWVELNHDIALLCTNIFLFILGPRLVYGIPTIKMTEAVKKINYQVIIIN